VKSIDDSQPLLDTDLRRVQSVPGVKWAVPLFLRTVQIRLKDGSFQTVRLFGLDDDSLIGRPSSMVAGATSDLFTPDAVIIGKAESERLGNPRIGDIFELNDHRARVVGIANVSRDFGSNPYVYTTYDRALDYAPPQRRQLNFVLAAPRDGVSLDVLVARIRAVTGLGAYTFEGMRHLSIGYYLRNTAIPVNFGLGLFMVFLVGLSVAGQSFHAFALQNERFLAAMKAMGTGNLTLSLMSVTQALTVGLISFGIGSGAACLFGYLTGAGTGKLAFYTTWQLMLVSFVELVLICLLSSLFAVRRVVRLEPGLVFRA
jgi:putative ABC transport system permease protein